MDVLYLIFQGKGKREDNLGKISNIYERIIFRSNRLTTAPKVEIILGINIYNFMLWTLRLEVALKPLSSCRNRAWKSGVIWKQNKF